MSSAAEMVNVAPASLPVSYTGAYSPSDSVTDAKTSPVLDTRITPICGELYLTTVTTSSLPSTVKGTGVESRV